MATSGWYVHVLACRQHDMTDRAVNCVQKLGKTVELGHVLAFLLEAWTSLHALAQRGRLVSGDRPRLV